MWDGARPRARREVLGHREAVIAAYPRAEDERLGPLTRKIPDASRKCKLLLASAFHAIVVGCIHLAARSARALVTSDQNPDQPCKA